MIRGRVAVLYLTVLVIATSGLVYELIAGTLASYVLGDSVTQFSTTIGAYLFAMGLGSFLSKYVDAPAVRFLDIELAVALVGGLSAPFLFVMFSHSQSFSIFLYGTIGTTGVLVGLEIPLLMRILRDELDFKDLVARVLGVDYIGALFGSVLFAIVLMPRLGLNRTSILFGLLNAAVAALGTFALSRVLSRRQVVLFRIKATVVALVLLTAMANAESLTRFGESQLYADDIVFAKRSPYQRIILTQDRKSTQLFLNGNLQFSSRDEYRYHETLVHPAMSLATGAARALVLGGGDGLAVRELFRYPSIEHVDLIDLDAEVTRLASDNHRLRQLNEGTLHDPRVVITNSDAFLWLSERGRSEPYDIVIIDFPDPGNYSLGKLYSRHFYRMLKERLHPASVVVVQSTSPYYARRSYWSIVQTIEDAGFSTLPYHTHVPSFGEWGYILATLSKRSPPRSLRAQNLRYLNDEMLPGLFVFGKDVSRIDVEGNRLNSQVLVRYYTEDWKEWH